MSDPVLDLLKIKGIAYSISGKDYVTSCLNPEHTDNNPSFRIDRTTGIAHCFSCGFKTNLFKHFGLSTNNISVRVAKLKQKLLDVQASSSGLDMLEGAHPVSGSFRGISAKTLKHFGAFCTDAVDKMEDRIIFPITDVRGKIICYVGRHTYSDGNPRYQNYPAGAVVPLFPARFDEPTTSIILVEGIFDMLNLYDNGITNVVCTFGTSKLFSDVSDKLLPYKVAGVTKVFIMYDGDDAGKEAAKKTLPLIEEAGYIAEIYKLPDGQDPGALTAKYIEGIKEYIS